MPTVLVKPKAIHVKVTNGASGEYVKVTNLTSGSSITGVLNSKLEVVVNIPGSNGDAILVRSQGSVLGSEKTTISGGGTTVTIGEGAATSFPSVSL